MKIRLLSICTLVLPLALPAADYHVAGTGSDANAGSADKPFATLAAARDAARQAPAGPHRIVVHAGDYFLDEPLLLDARDNGLSIVGEARDAVRIFGGRKVTGWTRDGERFWQAPLPGVKEGEWDFRALLVNGRLAAKATWPNSTDTLEHLGQWDLPLLPMLAGYWARPPTREELTVMPYKEGDIPADIDIANAEVRLYHMWAESLVGVESHDKEKHVLVMSSPAVWPMGACNRRKYVIYNIREGMTEPGQWYLDRSNGRLVYWPLPDEDMADIEIIAPCMDRIVVIEGNRERPVKDVTLQNLSIHCSSSALKSPGFGSSALDGAVELRHALDCVLDNLRVTQVGGLGVSVNSSRGGALRNSEVGQTGACGVKLGVHGMRVENNHIHHLGRYYPGAAGVLMGGDGIELVRNVIHDVPYSGVIGGGGKECLIEENLVYHAMMVMHDGAAIYGNLRQSIIRGNVVRDIRPNGAGFGASGYYLDEGSYDCVIENNVSFNVARPTHNHITRGTIIRNNVFISEEDMTVSFQRSENMTFSGNTLYVKGKLRVVDRNAAKVWEDNRIFRGDGKDGFRFESWVPLTPPEAPKTQPVQAKAMSAPVLDAAVTAEEWPVPAITLDRDEQSYVPGGPPSRAQVGFDAANLYVNLQVNRFRGTSISEGDVWEKDDGAEIIIQGKTPAGRDALLRIRGFAGGTVSCIAGEGASPAMAEALQRGVVFSGKVSRTKWGAVMGWKGEWAIPFAALGISPEIGHDMPFNIRLFISETGEWRGWEAQMGKLKFVE
jgi:hypothetical protein